MLDLQRRIEAGLNQLSSLNGKMINVFEKELQASEMVATKK